MKPFMFLNEVCRECHVSGQATVPSQLEVASSLQLHLEIPPTNITTKLEDKGQLYRHLEQARLCAKGAKDSETRVHKMDFSTSCSCNASNKMAEDKCFSGQCWLCSTCTRYLNFTSQGRDSLLNQKEHSIFFHLGTGLKCTHLGSCEAPDERLKTQTQPPFPLASHHQTLVVRM